MLFKMKNCFLFALILVISLYTVSALYQGTISIGVGDDVELIVGDPLSFEVTNETEGNSGNGNGESPGILGGGGGSTDNTGTILGFSETETNNFSNVSDKEQISLNDDKGPEESTNSAPLTGAVTGIGNFAKSGAGALTLSVLVLVGAAVVIVLLRKKIAPRMKEEESGAESE